MDNELIVEPKQDAISRLEAIGHFLEYLAGERDDVPVALRSLGESYWFWALWWGALALVIFAFSGQSSKFIYIDF